MCGFTRLIYLQVRILSRSTVWPSGGLACVGRTRVSVVREFYGNIREECHGAYWPRGVFLTDSAVCASVS